MADEKKVEETVAKKPAAKKSTTKAAAAKAEAPAEPHVQDGNGSAGASPSRRNPSEQAAKGTRSS